MLGSRRSRRRGEERIARQSGFAAVAPSLLASGRWARRWLRALAIALGFFLIVRSFLIEAFRIPTGSMENTLLAGDFLLVNKAVFGARVPLAGVSLPALAEPVRGDVVIFNPDHDPRHSYVKRTIGVPGDTLEMRGKLVYRNEQPLAEPYARHAARTDAYDARLRWQCESPAAGTGWRGHCRPTRENWGPVVVPAGHYFVLGDNRDASEDSRYWGFLPRAAIRGEPLVVYFSVAPTRAAQPGARGIRWSRLGHTVH